MKKILIVDDSLFMRITLKNLLSENGHEIIGEAEDGYDAIDKYKKYQPDLVTMDITMPFLNGVDAAKEILKLYPEAKILIVSALGKKDDILDLLKIGIVDYLIKPINPERFLSTVNSIFEQ